MRNDQLACRYWQIVDVELMALLWRIKKPGSLCGYLVTNVVQQDVMQAYGAGRTTAYVPRTGAICDALRLTAVV